MEGIFRSLKKLIIINGFKANKMFLVAVVAGSKNFKILVKKWEKINKFIIGIKE